jgi:hypothetical protein
MATYEVSQNMTCHVNAKCVKYDKSLVDDMLKLDDGT